jgi:pyridoxamine 5'-phosphate oxidase
MSGGFFMNEQINKNINLLVKESRDAIVCSIDEYGFPNAKAMFISKCEGIHTFWFSTNVSSERIQQWSKCPNACLYFIDSSKIHGLMLKGKMDIFTDNETKRKFWRQGDEQYYTLGPTDPDYCMIRFTTNEGNYWEEEKYILNTEMIREI